MKGKIMSIEEKLFELRKKVPYVQKEKSKDSSSQLKYTFVSSANIMGIIRPALDELKILVIKEVVESNVNCVNTTNKSGDPKVKYLTQLVMRYTLIDTTDNTKLVVNWYGQGFESDSEKGFGKALTYSEKYFWLKQLDVQTGDDDPDEIQESRETKSDKSILMSLLSMCRRCETYEEYTGKIVPYYLSHGPEMTEVEREEIKVVMKSTVDKVKPVEAAV